MPMKNSKTTYFFVATAQLGTKKQLDSLKIRSKLSKPQAKFTYQKQISLPVHRLVVVRPWPNIVPMVNL